MTLFLSPDTELITQDKMGRTTIKEMQVKSKIIFDGFEWLGSTYSSIVAHTMDMYKVTFSDGKSIIIGDDQHILMSVGTKFKPKRLNSRADIALGRFHKLIYKSLLDDAVELDVFDNTIRVIGVKFSHRGVAYGLDNLSKDQAICLANGVILQN